MDLNAIFKISKNWDYFSVIYDKNGWSQKFDIHEKKNIKKKNKKTNQFFLMGLIVLIFQLMVIFMLQIIIQQRY